MTGSIHASYSCAINGFSAAPVAVSVTSLMQAKRNLAPCMFAPPSHHKLACSAITAASVDTWESVGHHPTIRLSKSVCLHHGVALHRQRSDL